MFIESDDNPSKISSGGRTIVRQLFWKPITGENKDKLSIGPK